MGDWVIFKGLRIRRSEVGRILKHLDKLRNETRRFRAEIVALKDGGSIWEDLGRDNPYQNLIEAFEKSIADNQREMDDLRKALQNAMKSQAREGSV